jgi:hypothetical protein
MTPRMPVERILAKVIFHIGRGARVLTSYADYYNRLRTHRSLNKDARSLASPGSAKR